jgi:ribosomal protein L24E
VGFQCAAPPGSTGEIYVCFDETDLFTKAKTPEMVALEKVGIEPKFVRWTTWG